MKKGKFIPIGHYKNVKIGFGTVDNKNLKTIYVKFNSWLLPESDEYDFDRIIIKTIRAIKLGIYNLNNNYFKNESIVDLDVRTKGLKLEKKSFMNLEVTLFTKSQFDIRDKDIKIFLKAMSVKIINDTLIDKNLFNFHKNKK